MFDNIKAESTLIRYWYVITHHLVKPDCTSKHVDHVPSYSYDRTIAVKGRGLTISPIKNVTYITVDDML